MTRLVTPDAAQAHIRTLYTHGYTQTLIAHEAGLHRETVSKIARATTGKLVNGNIADAILNVPIPTRPGPRVRTDETWKDEGVCASIGPLDDMWFPPKGGCDSNQVRTICASCPVQYHCLTAALDEKVTDDFGFWAGTSPTERRNLRRKKIYSRADWRTTDAPHPEQARAARLHHRDGRSVEWIAYALHLTDKATRTTLTKPRKKTARAAA